MQIFHIYGSWGKGQKPLSFLLNIEPFDNFYIDKANTALDKFRFSVFSIDSKIFAAYAGSSLFFFFQGIVGTVGSSFYYISVFLSSLLPGVLEPRLGIAGMFAVFAGITALFLSLVVLLVPETAGKSYPDFISDQALNRTFTLWLPDLKDQPLNAQKNREGPVHDSSQDNQEESVKA